MADLVGTIDESGKATSREWLGLAVIALPCMLYSMDLTVLNIAVPALTVDLRPTAAQMLWIIDIYGFMVAGLLMIMGTLGDRIGRRKLLLIGAAAFGAASVLAAYSTTAEMLIIARALLGVAGATLAPSTLSLISSMFRDPDERTFAIGMWISSFSVGAVIGPLVGGVLIQYFWWGSVFLAGVPVMILLLILGPLLLPEYRDPNAGRIDVVSALQSLVAVLAIIYGIKRIAEAGLAWLPVLTIFLGVAVGIIFVRRQAMLKDPLVDLKLFRSRTFNTALCINGVGVFFMFGAYIFLAQYFQLVIGLTALEAGLWSTPSAVAFTVMSMFTPGLTRRMQPVHLMAAGMLVSCIGFVGLAFASGLVAVVLSSVVFFVGFTPVVTLTTNLIVSAAPIERAGAASALSETASELGGALGIALLGSLSTAIYRARMAESVPTELPDGIELAARATLSGAIDAARHLPTEPATALLAVARAAFNQGLQTTALLAACGMLAAAIATIVVLRDCHQQPDVRHA